MILNIFYYLYILKLRKKTFSKYILCICESCISILYVAFCIFNTRRFTFRKSHDKLEVKSVMCMSAVCSNFLDLGYMFGGRQGQTKICDSTRNDETIYLTTVRALVGLCLVSCNTAACYYKCKVHRACTLHAYIHHYTLMCVTSIC